MGGDRLLARRLIRPVARFLRIEAAGGILLLVATAVSLVWGNVAPGSYDSFWLTPVHLVPGAMGLDMSLQEWVNQGLMVVFFFVVGMEIKREVVSGELRDPRAAALPVLAAVGGMVVPALIYVAINAGGAGSRGWGIPMATDIAFAVGVVSLLGTRVPVSLKLFLLTLAVVDDLGGIVVIAIWYAHGVGFAWLAGAAAVFVSVYLLERRGVWHLPVNLVLGVVAWYCMLRSGVHATIAGVVAGLLIPTRPSRSETHEEAISVNQRLTDLLHPWSGLLIIPIFALANAAIPLNRESLSASLSSRVTLGVFLGLVLGKTVGVSLATFVAIRLRIGARPRGAANSQIIGISMIAGIGFTVAMFMASLSFVDVALQDEAKVGIFAASIVAAVMGSVVMVVSHLRATPAEIAFEDHAEDELFAEEPELDPGSDPQATGTPNRRRGSRPDT